MSQRPECNKILQVIFQQHQILHSEVRQDQAIDLQCQVALWGYLLRQGNQGRGF